MSGFAIFSLNLAIYHNVMIERSFMNLASITFYGRARLIVVSFFVVFCVNCASNPEETIITFSGFLEDYSGFRPAPDGGGAWTYRKPGTNLKPYTKIMIDPLVIWSGPDSKKEGINDMDLWRLELTFRDKMVQALKVRYTIVNKPGPEVLRLHAALTNIQETRPHAHIHTPGPVLPAASDFFVLATETLTSTRFLVGDASIEAEILDSFSHERLFGYIEHRESSKTYANKNPYTLAPFAEIFSYWGEDLRQRLDKAKREPGHSP